MSFSGVKNNDNNTTKYKAIAATGGGGGSSSSKEFQNKNEAPKGTTTRVKKERPREAPVSKYHDLIMHGVKPWDPDANDFYDSLLEARRELDAWQDKHSK